MAKLTHIHVSLSAADLLPIRIATLLYRYAPMISRWRCQKIPEILSLWWASAHLTNVVLGSKRLWGKPVTWYAPGILLSYLLSRCIACWEFLINQSIQGPLYSPIRSEMGVLPNLTTLWSKREPISVIIVRDSFNLYNMAYSRSPSLKFS